MWLLVGMGAVGGWLVGNVGVFRDLGLGLALFPQLGTQKGAPRVDIALGPKKTFDFIHENMQHLEESGGAPPHMYLFIFDLKSALQRAFRCPTRRCSRNCE